MDSIFYLSLITLFVIAGTMVLIIRDHIKWTLCKPKKKTKFTPEQMKMFEAACCGDNPPKGK